MRDRLVLEIVNDGLTIQFMKAFDWQCGTVHEVVEEIIARGLGELPAMQALLKIVLANNLTKETTEDVL